MVVGPRFWWKQIKQHPFLLIPFLIALFLTILIGGYTLNWAWTGFTGPTETYKTLYDWLQLLFVPAALTAFGFYLNYRERKAAEQRASKERQEEERRTIYEQKAAELRTESELKIEQQRAETERRIAKDNQCEVALQAYIDEMSELLLHEKLRNSREEDEVQKIARVRTLTVLPRLDSKRKGIVLQFLHESGLIYRNNTIVDLRVADLDSANLSKAKLDNACLNGAHLNDANLYLVDLTSAHLFGTYLRRANLQLASLKNTALCYAFLENANLSRAYLYGADLSGANLTGADLSDANLSSTNLSEATLTGTNLNNANLSSANLSEATIASEQLEKAKSLKGATMPDRSIHP